MAEVIKRGNINQAYKEITALYGDAVDVEIRVIDPSLNKKRDPKFTKIIEQARTELKKKNAAGYTHEQAGEDFIKLQDEISPYIK